jgi:RNA polymerase sigma factor (sigma-70 family)
MPDDIELLRHYAENGAEAAFTELVRRHVNLVYSAALRRVGGDAHLAEDVTQQVFIALARQAPVLSGRAVLTGWLYTAARFVSARVVRAEKRRKAREQEAYIMNENPMPDPDWDRLRPILDTAMDRLNDREREALLLRFFEGRPFAEMGAKLSLTEDAARMRVDRALDKLRGLLGRQGVGSTATAIGLLLESQTVTAAPAGLAAAIAGKSLASTGITSTAFNLFHIMSTSKLTTGAATILALLAIGTATHEIRASHASTAALALADQDIVLAHARLQQLGRALQDAEQRGADLEKAIEATRRSQAAEDARAANITAATIATIKDPVAAGREFLAAHPEAPQLVTNYERARTIERYGPLFRQLGLTPEQIERFQLLVSQGPGSGLGWSTAQQAPAGRFNVGSVGLSNAELEDRLHGLLGDSGYQQYQDFNRLAPARGFVTELAGTTAVAGAGLSADQAGQMTQILAQNSPAYQNGRSVNSDTIEWDAAMPALQKLLSAAQFAAFEGLRQQAPFQRALNQAANQAENDAMKAVAQDPSHLPVR